MIGILTFNDTNNFGSLLQTYALYEALSKIDPSCEIINYRCARLYDREIPKPFTQIRGIKDLYRFVRYHKEQKKKYDELTGFSDSYIQSSQLFDISNISSASSKYDKIIVGSDIVWGLDITGDDYSYFLDFSNNGNKYSYASSFGSDYILKDPRREHVAELLKSFNRISVREQDAVDIIKELSGKNAELVLDPTLLLDETEWGKFFSKRKIESPYILTYFEDDKGLIRKTALELSQKYNCEVLNITNGKKMEGVRNIPVYSLEEFLSYIKNAEHIVTASYHGLAFSINFNKQFNFYNRAHRSRMNTLSKIAGLSDREILPDGSYSDYHIDFSSANDRIKRMRILSTSYLQSIVRD